MNVKALIVMLAVAAGFGLAACGDSDDEDKDSGLSRSELATKADAICKTGETEAAGVTAPADFNDPVEAAAYFTKIVPLHQKQTDSLAALKPDGEAKADWDEFMARQNENNTLLITLRDKAKAKDASGVQDLQKFTSNSAAFGAAATKLGADDCAGTS